MEILIASNLYPPDIGGPATYVSRLAKGLLERGHQIRVVTVSSETHQTAEYPLTLISRDVPVLKRLKQVYRELLKQGETADLIYSNCIDLPCLWAAKKLKKPLFVKIVGDQAWERSRVAGWTRDDIDNFQEKRHGPKIAFLKYARAKAVKKAVGVITPSHYLKSIVQGWGVPAEKITVVHNAVSIETGGKILDAHKAFFEKEGQVILSLGRLVNWKGNDLTIQALADLPEQVRYCVGGDGPDLESLKKIAIDCGVAKRVLFAGKIERENVPAYLQSAFLFSQPTGYEGLPHTVIEAQANGCPVITTDKCGNPEAVENEHSGLLVPYLDRGALITGIKRFIDDKKLREDIIKNARKTVDYFNWERLFAETEQAFFSVLP
jgi:glycosyltransferase involved in cell wall biosynthesis